MFISNDREDKGVHRANSRERSHGEVQLVQELRRAKGNCK